LETAIGGRHLSIVVEELAHTPTAEQRVEIVERKGRGHPDHICDAIADEISVRLCQEYQKHFGLILHHNIDKALLSAGTAENRFGGGRILDPMRFIIGDRATQKVGDIEIPVHDLALAAARDWFQKNLRFVNFDQHVRFQSELKQGSAALQDIFARKGQRLGANDTSAAVGFAPLTPTERLVLETERFLNSSEFKKRHPESGEDIKVMGLRTNHNIDVTIAMAMVDRWIESEGQYFRRKEEMLAELREFVRTFDHFEGARFQLNALDQQGRGLGGLYLTVLGTSADGGDSGQVGRGNRVNGLISLNRPAGAEAAPGKNPVSHVGKIYGLLSFRLADQIYQQVGGLKEVYVWLLSEIGRPIDQPKAIAAQVVSASPTDLAHVRAKAAKIVAAELEHIDDFTAGLARGIAAVC
jgi:S-adenosylmethionine synthetase